MNKTAPLTSSVTPRSVTSSSAKMSLGLSLTEENPNLSFFEDFLMEEPMLILILLTFMGLPCRPRWEFRMDCSVGMWMVYR